MMEKRKSSLFAPVTDGVHLYFVEAKPWTTGSRIAQLRRVPHFLCYHPRHTFSACHFVQISWPRSFHDSSLERL
jgi:hypothetical protein